VCDSRRVHRAACVLLACCGSTATPGPAAKGSIANTRPEAVVLSFRVLHVHDAESSVLEMEQLTIDGTRASLVLGSKTTSMPADGGPVCTMSASGTEQCNPTTTIDGWQNEGSATMTGTAERRDTGLVLDLPRPDPRSPHLVMGCTEHWVEVAPANAIVLARSDCAWSLTTERIKVLACVTKGEMTPFAPFPGVEQVDPDHETMQCDDRPMYRRVPADGSVAPAVAR
jgi:hypothetical protein